MDRRDAIPLSGSAAYYMQQAMAGSGPGDQSGLLRSPGMHPLSSATLSFQPSVGSGSVQPTLTAEPSSGMPSQGVSSGTQSAVMLSEPVRRRRGRPRKYVADGSVSLGLSSSSSVAASMVEPERKRGRGRPPGSGRKQQVPPFGAWLPGIPGYGFTPHVIPISIGEDIATKIRSFTQQGPRAVCILSATGAVSTVTLRYASTNGGSVTYEGRFEIIGLSGCYLSSSTDGTQNPTGDLAVSLASPDGHVIGGGVAGTLIAASSVQVIVGSFVLGNPKNKNKEGEGASSDGARESNNQPVDEQVNQTSVQAAQSLSSPPSTGVWSNFRPAHLRDTNVDIDLMRG